MDCHCPWLDRTRVTFCHGVSWALGTSLGKFFSSHRLSSYPDTAFTRILIISVTLVIVTVPEGFPPAVTLALAFATKWMTEENLLVHILSSCETIANTSVVCTNEAGMLTQNVTSIVAGSIGIHTGFVCNLGGNKARINAPDQEWARPQEQDVTDAADESQVTLQTRRRFLYQTRQHQFDCL